MKPRLILLVFFIIALSHSACKKKEQTTPVVIPPAVIDSSKLPHPQIIYTPAYPSTDTFYGYSDGGLYSGQAGIKDSSTVYIFYKSPDTIVIYSLSFGYMRDAFYDTFSNPKTLLSGISFNYLVRNSNITEQRGDSYSFTIADNNEYNNLTGSMAQQIDFHFDDFTGTFSLYKTNH